MNDINIDETLSKIDKDVDKLLVKIENINRQIDDIEIGYLSQTDAVYSIELLEHITQRKNTLSQRKIDHRIDVEALRVKEQQLIELKVINQYSLLSPEILQMISSIRSKEVPAAHSAKDNEKIKLDDEIKLDQKTAMPSMFDIFDVSRFDIYAGHYVI